ncbi:hypothetical protein [Ensifer sp. LCM 4579]|uniref:hypothetical protein n=1 Tax=Ensifer sp. LCM 4579 TaxID=1848292 RepID=UPI0008DAD5A8|nr:hypothetical protein [Ensifer sp. LCM 4579]OHV80282.1 hypothetical protein LCM4579_22070 [Ensifer sp. LCM 4579]
MGQDDGISSGNEESFGDVGGWEISAEGVPPDVLGLANAWLKAGEGDPLAALILMSERLLAWRTLSSSGMTRGALSIFPEHIERGKAE